jgi:queuine tRNA-ribosyltransferase
MLGARLNTLHNLHYYQQLMTELRRAIELRRLGEFTSEFAREQEASC